MVAAWSLVSLGSAHAVAAPGRTQTHEVRTASTIGISNASVSITFDRVTGALRGLRNEATRDEYLKDPAREGNPFRVYVDTTELPAAATDPGWWSGKVEGSMGGRIVDAADCRLIATEYKRTANGGDLRLTYRHEGLGLRFELLVRMPNADCVADCTLTVRNTGAEARTAMTAFPHLTGLQLGATRDTNLGLMLASYGTPGVRAWMESGGFYGRECSMQWQAVYEPSRDEGFGFITMDPTLQAKLIRRFAPSGMSALYLPADPLPPGASRTYPTARMIVHRGNWRVVARRYGEWFRSAVKTRTPPPWLRNVDLYVGSWIPDAASVAKAQATGEGFRSFAQLPDLFLNDMYDLKEFAQYNDGVRAHPDTYGAYMADGVYEFRRDLGGAVAAREGVERLHRIGRRVMFYIAGNSILKDSPVLAGSRLEDWLLMDRPGHGYDIGYPNGISVCPGYAPWQDHLARTARRILAETGADGIRLDELGSFVPCFNPAHHHRSPLDSNQWMRELVRKVRAAMDEVNPNAILCTEGPIDYLHESCDGALQMFQPGRDIDAMRVAIPDYVGFAYHPGAVESALNGWVGGKTTARRIEWPWAHRGLAGRPTDYGEGAGPELRWHELRASFPEAVAEGEVTPADPVAPDNPKWVGRLWKGRRYWLLIGGTQDASPLGGPVEVRLPELPGRVHTAYEFDAATLAAHSAAVRREGGSARVTMSADFGAVLLPLPDCPALLRTPEPMPDARVGSEIALAIRAVAVGSNAAAPRSVRATCPGLLDEPQRVTLPGTLRFRIPADAHPGYYALRMTGDCLPLKRWIRVVP
jgi:hypothetical protein